MRRADPAARDWLLSRRLTILRRQAHGWLPSRVRIFLGTENPVRFTLLWPLNSLGGFELKREGAFLEFGRAARRISALARTLNARKKTATHTWIRQIERENLRQ